MSALTMANICKSYGNVPVIENLSLAIKDGEFVVLVGPSGCGKSTLLRMIAGLESISGGQLTIADEVANDTPPQKRNIAMVFQSYALFPHMSVLENIEFGPKVRGESKEETAKRVEKASNILNLQDYLDRRPRQLSGGQRQRVAMGRSIVRDPKVFLFDEPLSNLDAKLRVQMRTEIKALHQTLGTTTVYVTHDQIEAMTMADRIVVMNNGVIEQIGAPMELYDRPSNIFVASFIGSPAMSMLPARHLVDGSSSCLQLQDGTLLEAPQSSAGHDHDVVIGIRPEHYDHDDEGPLALNVQVVEPTGPEVHVFGKLADTNVRAVFRDRTIPNPGDTLRLSIKPENLHLFDAADGKRRS
ncbi:MAG: sn-glycerol-3-phosphate ABC transporter ATP-binding protein UgpC [Pseudomonadota bacterium]